MYGAEAGPLSFLVVAGLVGLYAYERYQEWVEPTDEEVLKQAYADGEIDEAEFERRMGYLLDERNEEIVDWLERNVSGVADAKGKRIAKRFDSLDELRQADHGDLVDIHGIGDSTATAIRREFES